ncbi:MAG: acetate kinase [Verrucomicrobia bacterium]|nr:MAG: acetate kinase [Verrucomicrobiota bacterium]
MRILVANLGSTSFKYRLFQIDDREERLLARGGFERVEDYGRAIDACVEALRAEGHIERLEDLDGVGFKTVLGRHLSGCLPADDRVLEALDGAADLAPAHNPPYAAGIRQFRLKAPGLPLVALFETAFFQWMPEPARRYAVPPSWHEAGVRRHGFHGASHKFVAERSAELLGRVDIADTVRNLYRDGPRPNPGAPLRVISCHLGGSSSVAGIRDGVAIGSSLGMSPQSGLPHNNRVGDLDSAAVPFALRAMGLSLEEVERDLTRRSGLLGLSGVSNDLRDIREAAEAGNADARLAMDFLVHEIRRWAGGFFFEMGGCEAIVFTGGIGEHNPWLREAVCRGLESLGITIDPAKNAANDGTEGDIAADDSRTRLFVIPANEELVIARETRRLLLDNPRAG